MSRNWSSAGPTFAAALIAAAALFALTQSRADEPATFYRGINLNGPPLVIDRQKWEGGDAADLACDDAAFEGQSVILTPPTDEPRAKMIRSSQSASHEKATPSGSLAIGKLQTCQRTGTGPKLVGFNP
jgi:hypothetical protein